LKTNDHNIGIKEKRQFFRWNLGKIAENCDHNIDPCNSRALSRSIISFNHANFAINVSNIFFVRLYIKVRWIFLTGNWNEDVLLVVLRLHQLRLHAQLHFDALLAKLAVPWTGT
jgi:hypothetical protein